MLTKIIHKTSHAYKLCHSRAKEGHLSTLRQICEITYLQATQGIGYWHYHSARMWHKDSQWRDKLNMLGSRQFVKRIFQLNQWKYHGVSQYKPFEKAYFKLFNIPTARHLGTFNQDWGVTEDGKPLKSMLDLKELLQKHIGQKVCFKMVVGHGGQGFKAFEIMENGTELMAHHLSTQQDYSLPELVNLLQDENSAGWVIEDYIQQHPGMAEFNPTSLNTIRMFVYENNQGECVPLGSYLRIGAEGSLIDNLEGGGFGVEVDHRTGELIKDCIFCISDDHPLLFPDKDTATIKGNRIPFWKEAEEMGLKALRCYPNTRFLGLDISITEEGPVMIEMNILPSYLGLVWLRLKTKILLFQ